jgi:hypothetical protein
MFHLEILYDLDARRGRLCGEEGSDSGEPHQFNARPGVHRGTRTVVAGARTRGVIPNRDASNIQAPLIYQRNWAMDTQADPWELRGCGLYVTDVSAFAEPEGHVRTRRRRD